MIIEKVLWEVGVSTMPRFYVLHDEDKRNIL